MVEPEPSERPAAESRRWFRVVSVGALLVVSAPLFGALWLTGPYLRDDRRLDHAVRAVALDWRDFGRDAAVTRLQHELDHQRIGAHVSDDHCVFEELDGERTVRCAWEVDVQALGRTVPLTFESNARITADGDLR